MGKSQVSGEACTGNSESVYWGVVKCVQGSGEVCTGKSWECVLGSGEVFMGEW